jgi:hydrogenase maturation protease
VNLARVEQIAKAVLYEGYMLYPYRPSSVKNRQRFNFGVLYPEAYCDAQEGADPCSMQTECLIRGTRGAAIEVRVRFLHLQIRRRRDSALPDDWQEAVEQEICLPECSLHELCEGMAHTFAFPPRSDAEFSQESVEGVVDASAQGLREDLLKISLRVHNTTPLKGSVDRNDALMHSLVSTHVVLGVTDGEFISLLEPSEGLEDLAASCQNVGAWPVLVGDPGQRDTLLASPIILYDYPEIAPESAGDLFDGTEIDEILSLRIMTLTDQEKQEMRRSDDRARQILERTESMPAEQFMKLHGVARAVRPTRGGHP